MLLVEKKTRAQEALSQTNKNDITHILKILDDIKTYQREIDKYLRENYRMRGMSYLDTLN